MKKPSMISILLFLTGLLCIIALIFFNRTTLHQILTTEKEVDTISELPELIAQENVEMPEYVTVSINEEFVASEDKESTVLKEGDNVEFLYFMGGGC